MDINAVNALPLEDYMRIFGNVVEKCPMIAAAAWSQRPFASFHALETAINDFIDALPESGKDGILRCLTVLAGRDLQMGTLTQESREEQRRAGLDALEPGEKLRMAQLNEEYTARFGFPFVICSRMNDRASILRQLCESCHGEREAERARGVDELKKICHLRLQGLVRTDAPNK